MQISSTTRVVLKENPAMNDDRLYVLLANRIIDKIKQFEYSEATPQTLNVMFNTVEETVSELFRCATFHSIESRTVRFIALHYFERIKINDDQFVSDLIMVNPIGVDELTLNDVLYLDRIFHDTPLGAALKSRLK